MAVELKQDPPRVPIFPKRVPATGATALVVVKRKCQVSDGRLLEEGQRVKILEADFTEKLFVRVGAKP